MEILSTDLAYIAGFFDGEGCIVGIKRKTQCQRVRINIGQRKPEILFWIMKLLNMGHVYNLSSSRNNSWRVSNKDDIERFIDLILPYSRIKKEELIVGRELNNLTGKDRSHSEKKMMLFNQLKMLKHEKGRHLK